MTMSKMDCSEFDPNDDKNLSFFNYIISVSLPKGSKPPTNIEYDGTSDLQEHLEAFCSSMYLAGAFPIKHLRLYIWEKNKKINGIISRINVYMEKHLKNIARTYENWKRNPSKPNPL